MQFVSRLISTRPIFEVSEQLRAALAPHWEDSPDLTEFSGAFLLDPGLGPPTYLSLDGRILWLDDMWDVRATRREAFMSITAGFIKTHVALLLALLPPRPADAEDCPQCGESGRFKMVATDGTEFAPACGACGSLGWAASTAWLDEVLTDLTV